MATSMTAVRSPEPRRPTSSRRKKEQRADIWSNLLRQTREAQARSRTQALQTRDIILCGGSPEDQRAFVDRYLARPPAVQPVTRTQRDQRPQRQNGDVRLSNRFGYGYGHVTLYSPPQPSSGAAGLFGGEAEEVARVDVHTIPEAEPAYEDTLRRLLVPKKEVVQSLDEDDAMIQETVEQEGRRAAICILMSWKEPWLFLDRLCRWLALLSRSLLPAAARKDELPTEVLKEHKVSVAMVLQHTDHQEMLLRDAYSEESFDYISQCLRTCLLPIAGALLFVPTNLPPQQPGGPLSEVQKVLYTNLDLPVAALQAKGGKLDVAPKHNVVDRMAIVVPSGWDSIGKIRLLSETFSPEAITEGWSTDLLVPIFPVVPTHVEELEESNGPQADHGDVSQSSGGAEVFESTHQPSPMAASPPPSPLLSPSKMPKSAIADYERLVQDPNAHKAPKAPEIEVTTKPEQEFLAEMRAQLQQYEAQDALHRKDANTTAGSHSAGRSQLSASTATGEALSELGDYSFNVGGVSYNTSTAEQAIERLKRPALGSSTDSRSGTPRPSKRETKDSADGTPSSSSKSGDIPTEKLEEYFASLMKRGGGGSQSGTPSKS